MNLKEKKTEILLHVGLHKTGSTFLQRQVFPKIENSVTYYINEDIRPEDRNKLVIVTDESFTASMNRTVKSRQEYLADILKRQYPDAKVLMVFRNKTGFVNSLYSQYVKMGGVHNYQRWRNKRFDEDALDYERVESLYRGLFKDVLVLDYQMLREDCPGFIKKICDYMGRPVPSYVNRRTNRRLKRWMILPIRIMNMLCNTPMNARPGILPYCMHPKFGYLCLHWKKHRSDKKILRSMMFYGAQKEEKRIG